MNRDIKDIINSVEQKNQLKYEYEKELNLLRERIKTLNFTIKEQKLLIQEQGSSLKEIDFREGPQDASLLKETIIAQSQEIKKKNKDIAILEQNIDNLKAKIKNYRIENKSNLLNDEIIKAKKKIIQLTEENEIARKYEKNARDLVKQLTDENKAYLLDINKFKNKIRTLKKTLKDNVNESNYKQIYNQNVKLKKILQIKKNELSVNQCKSITFEKILFKKIYNLLDEEKKIFLIDFLMTGLIKTKNNDIKRYIIEILSEFKNDEKICKSLINMLDSEDWLNKLYIIRALGKFEKKFIKDTMEKLLNDTDLDVREAAKKILIKLS